MVCKAVEERSGHLGVAKDGGPFTEVEVGGYDDRGALVEAADEVEQQLAAGLGERKVAKLVEDQEVEAAQQVSRAPLPVGTSFGIELVHQVDGVEEPSSFASPDAGPGDAHGKVGFAGPGATDEHDIALLFKEIPGGQVAHQRLVDRRALEAELVDLFRQRQFGDGHLVFDRGRLLLADLGVKQVTDDLLRFMLPLHRRGDDLIVGGLHAVELQLARRAGGTPKA